MAKIAFFTERIPPDPDPIAMFSYQLMQGLADQQHEVRVFSTYQRGAELPAPHSRIEILRPFQNWGWLEIPRLIPILLDFQPDVLHVIQPRLESMRGLTSAMTAIPALKPLIGRPAVIASFYDLRAKDLRLHRTLFRFADAITTANSSQKDHLEFFLDGLGLSIPLAVLPIQTPNSTGNSPGSPTLTTLETQNESLSTFFALHDAVLFFPGNLDEYSDLETLFAEMTSLLMQLPKTAIVVGGGWGDIPRGTRHRFMRQLSVAEVGGRWLLTGPLDPCTERWCLRQAKLTSVASLAAESMPLARVLRAALDVSAAVVMNAEQALVDALPWRHCETAFIASSSSGSEAAIRAAMAEPEQIEIIRARLPEFSRVEAFDQPVNVMSRLYSQILNKDRGHL